MKNIFKMNKEKALNKYGEYGVPYKIAKKLDCFKITWNVSYEDAKISIENFMIHDIKDKNFYKLDAICVMEFGNVDIEFMSYGVNDENKFDSGFYSCINCSDGGWESYGFTDLVFDIDMLEDKNKFEEIMYNSMIEYARKNNLCWSKEN